MTPPTRPGPAVAAIIVFRLINFGLTTLVGWLAFLVWRQLTLPERLFRCAVLVLIAALAIVSYASDGLLG